MLDNLTTRLARVMKTIKGEARLTESNIADALREVALQVPSDRILVETDSPYLAPIPHRGRPNFPEYVVDVAKFVAELRGVSYEKLAAQTTDNFKRLFPLARVQAS